VIPVGTDAPGHCAFAFEDLPAQLALHLGREVGEDQYDVLCLRQLSHLGEAEHRRGVQAAHLTEIHHDEARCRQVRIVYALADLIDESVGRAEEDEALEFKHIELFPFLPKQPARRSRTVDVAAVAGSRDDVFDHVDVEEAAHDGIGHVLYQIAQLEDAQRQEEETREE
jgi:hypothetical protein